MYPETDVPPVTPDPTTVDPPELLTEKVERYQTDHGLAPDLAEQIAYDERMQLFERAVDTGVDPTLAATTLMSTLTELRRDAVPVETLTDDQLIETFELVAAGELATEGVPDLLTALAAEPTLSAATAAEREGLGSAGEGDVRDAVQTVIERNSTQVTEEGMGAFSALMGECMGELRGKADGDIVSDVLREEIQRRS
jgi:glutamyl-tRNA(Gln) amidotransferase subunit E (EC 6.3.5.7)